MLKVSRLPIKKEKPSLFLLILFVFFLLVFVFYAISQRLSFLKKAAGPQLSESSAQPVRGQAGDLWADVVLGQRNFNEINPYETVADRLFNPGGVVIDKTVTPNMLYVLDSANNRVLGINLEECLQLKRTDPNSRCQAVRVIGQPDFVSNACNGDSGFQNYPNRAPASRESLCYLPEKAISPNEGGNAAALFIDTEGNLFLPDIHNNRLLKYNRISSADNIADEVWGQADFSGNQCNRGGQPTAGSLCLAEGNYSATAVLDQSGHLWVADSSNNRVLRYPKQTDGSISKRADLVLGQTNFSSGFSGSSLDKFINPSGLDFDSEGKLYVVDQRNDRVLIFSPPFTSGMTGQIFGRNFKLPVHIKIERIGIGQDKIWISDVHNNMIEVWNNQGTEVLKVFGQESYSPSLQSNRGDLCDPFGSFDYDSEGNLYTTNRCGIYWGEILFFPNLPGNVRQSSFRLFAPIGGNKNLYNFIGSRGLDSGRGIVVTDDQLIMADKNRILFWNNPQNLFNGRPMDGVVARHGDLDQLPDGQPNFLSQGAGKEFVRKDEIGNLWATTAIWGGEVPSITIYQLPLTTGKRPLKTISFGGQNCLSNLEGERICNPDGGWSLTGLQPSLDGSYVWVSHTLTNRVFRIRNPLSDNPRIDVILGQENSTEICCNREKNPDSSCKPWEQTTKNPSLNILCHPGAISQDNFGNLYVADYYLENAGNFRILIFRLEDLPTDNNHTLYGVSAFKEIKNIAAFDMAFDSQNRMIVGQNGYHGERSHFLAYFNDPLNQSTTQPDGYFKDYYSISFSAAFDRSNNLFVTDHNRARVLVYQNPFSSPLPSPRPSNTPGPTLTPTPTLSSRLIHNVDHPLQNGRYSTSFPFSGWTALEGGGRVEKVKFFLDNTSGYLGEALCNEYRPDLDTPVMRAYKNSGWHWHFNLSGVSNGWHKLDVIAYQADRSVGFPITRVFLVAVPTLTPTPRPLSTTIPTPTGPPVPTNTPTPTPTLAMPSCFGYDAGVLGRGLAVNYSFSGNNPHPLAKLQTKAFYKKTGGPWLTVGEVLRWSGRDYSIHTSQTSSLSPGFYQTSAEMVVFYDLNNNNIINSNEPKLFCRAGSCSNCQKTVEIPPLTNCPLEMNQEGDATVRLTDQYYDQYVRFSPDISGWVNKVAIKVYNSSVVSKQITCKVTDYKDQSVSVEKSSQPFNNSVSYRWVEVDFSTNPFLLSKSGTYKLYCKSSGTWASLYWVWDDAYPSSRPQQSRTVRIYLCPQW